VGTTPSDKGVEDEEVFPWQPVENVVVKRHGGYGGYKGSYESESSNGGQSEEVFLEKNKVTCKVSKVELHCCKASFGVRASFGRRHIGKQTV
jgi:hypothetical protein